MDTPDSFANLVHTLGGPKAVATALRLKEDVTRQWKHRNSIPGLYWPKVIELAQEKNIAVALDSLADFARRKRDESKRKLRRRRRKERVAQQASAA